MSGEQDIDTFLAMLVRAGISFVQDMSENQGAGTMTVELVSGPRANAVFLFSKRDGRLIAVTAA